MKRSPSHREGLDWEELEQAPNTKGAFSFLKSPAPVVNIEKHQTPSVAHSLTPTSRQDIAPAPDIPSTVVKTSTVDGLSTVDTMSTVDDLSAHTRKYRVHVCQRAQDAHSHGENRLYDALWHSGRAETDSTKIVTMGWDRMGAAAGMSDKAAKRNLTQLICKLAVEVVAAEDSSSRTGRTYRVFSYKLILERRAQKGMTHVVRDKGVRFVPAADGPTRTKMVLNDAQSIGKTSTVDKPSTVDKASTGTVGITSRDTVDKTSTPLGSLLGIKKKETTTNVVDVAAVAAAICEFLPGDRAAAERIVEAAVAACPGCTTADVVAAVRRKADQLLHQPNLVNPVGVLIASCTELVTATNAERLADEMRRAERATSSARAQSKERVDQWLRSLSSDNPWIQIAAVLRQSMPEQIYQTWLRPVRFAGVVDGGLRLCVPSEEFKCISERHADLFGSAILQLCLAINTVTCFTLEELAQIAEYNHAC